MYNVEFQRDLPRQLPRLEAQFGVVAMHRGLPVLAQDAQPILTTVPNSGIPAYLANFIDPDVLRIVFAPNKAVTILGVADGERKMGDWTTATAMFPVVERTGQVTSYGDFNDNGSAGANAQFPQRQSYHYQTVVQIGERESDVMSLARLNWIGEKREAATFAMEKFRNQTYFFGVRGLQNYGLLNDPALPASLAPAVKGYGGTQWVVGGVIKATPNEIFQDVQTMFIQLVSQAGGTVEMNQETPLVLAMSPTVQVALSAANTFNVNVFDLLKKNFPNIRFETAVQYQLPAGQLVQLIADKVEGQRTAFAAFTEKLRAHRVVMGMSSQKQKISGGTWGAIIRQPFAIVSMLGV